MDGTARIIGMIRTGAYAQPLIDKAIHDQVGPLVEKLTTTRDTAAIRAVVADYTREVYAAAADVVHREVSLRATAAVDAADSNARQRGQHAEALALARVVVGRRRLTARQNEALERAPIFFAQTLVEGGTPEEAVTAIAARDKRIGAMIERNR